MSIPQSFIQELLARADVVEVVGRYVPLKKAGANFQGLCPFHAEKSPSFSVSPTKQFYHCFGCGKNGNAIGFLMDHAGMGFVEAVKDLAQHYGLQVPEEDISPAERERAQAQRHKQSTLTDVLEKAAEAYRKHLKDSPRAVAYFKGRGVSGAVAKQFGLGYAPQGWRSLASVFPHYDDPLLVESGLVISNMAPNPGSARPPEGVQPSLGRPDERLAEEGTEEKRYDRFRDRVMFPIRNIKGECIGFGGRVLGDDKPKYLNSPETPVFSKGRELYGLFEARTALRERGYVLVTEGYMDVVALAQLGFPNAVATLGTACTADHVHKLFRFTDTVVFSFDGDAAGRRAARKALDAALPYASDVRSIKFLFLPPEHDPDSFIRERGADAFSQYVHDATPLSRFLVEAASDGCDLGSAEGRARMVSNARPLWQTLPEGALKLQLLGELAQLAQLGSAELSTLWASAPSGSAPSASSPPADDGQGGTSSVVPGWRTSAAGPRSTRPAARVRASRGGRARPNSRADHATRILLQHSALWDTLTAEDHCLLCALPAPHGGLLTWLEAQLHEHGPLPWGALRESLQGHAEEDTAVALQAHAAPVGDGAMADAALELRDLLNRMLIEDLKSQETEAIARADADPGALARYRQLHNRRLQIEANLQATNS
ncbi:MAG: DNA primase [Rhodoferax sp.]